MMLQTITDQNYFQFSDKYYKQNKGLAMGSCLSPLFSKVYLQHIEHKIVEHFKKHFLVKGYFRYVDDTLLILEPTSTHVELENEMEQLNSLDNHIKFTYESEMDNKINFLDITIEKIGGKLDFSIYRKPTTSSCIIHQLSNHPIEQKMASFQAYFHRLENIPMSEVNYNRELGIIYQLGEENGYKSRDICNLHYQIKRIKKKELQDKLHEINLVPFDKSKKDLSFRKFLFNHPYSYRFKKACNKVNINLGFNTNNKLKMNLHNVNKNNRGKLLESGIYRLNCGSCEGFYIGRTIRDFHTRFKEHVRDVKNIERSLTNKEDSIFPKTGFSQHVLKTKHDKVDISQLEILEIVKDHKKIEATEAFYIQKHKKDPNLLNNITDLKDNMILKWAQKLNFKTNNPT